MSNKRLTEKNINLLLSGKHPQVKKFAGKNVMVSGNDIVAMKDGKKLLKDLNKLTKKHKETPALVFVPHPGRAYIFYEEN